MTGHDDPSKLDEAQLVRAYVDNVQLYGTVHHVGRLNRLMQYRLRVVAALESRADGTPRALLGLLDHPDAKVRLVAATTCARLDHAASQRTLRALADRKDEIGVEARRSLERDKFFQTHGYPEAREDRPAVTGRFASRVQWQSDNPPPDAMTYPEIERLLRTSFSADCADQILHLARPAIGLWPRRPRPDLPATASRLGGMPSAPSGWSWPVYDTEPLFFLGQINCADLQGLPGADKLPSSGLLAFFADHDAVTGCEAPAPGQIAVFHWTGLDRLAPAVPPIEVLRVLPVCELALRPLIDIPAPFSYALEDLLSEEDAGRYHDIYGDVLGHGIPEDLRSYCSFGKLLGWPRLVQGDLDTIGDPSDPDGLRLLLQLDQYSNGSEIESWGPGGSLYFLITDDDLSAGRFDLCESEMQFG